MEADPSTLPANTRIEWRVDFFSSAPRQLQLEFPLTGRFAATSWGRGKAPSSRPRFLSPMTMGERWFAKRTGEGQTKQCADQPHNETDRHRYDQRHLRRDLHCGRTGVRLPVPVPRHRHGVPRMGPGYFPLVLAIVLVLLGAIVLVQATRVEGEPIGPVAWRGMLFILPAPIFFGLTVSRARLRAVAVPDRADRRLRFPHA